MMIAHRLSLLCFFAAACLEASDFSWTVNGQTSLELRHNLTETIARFQFDPEPADPHFDILKMVGGENLVWVGPDDHPWHYGHWFSWKYINKVNFWETNRKTGRSAGLTEVSEPTVRVQDDSAEVTYSRFYRIKADEEPVLQDDFLIQIHAPESAEHAVGPLIEWTVKTTALVDVTLDRTPIPGEPGGKKWGGYAGLSWRGAKALANVKFSDSEGQEGMDIHRERSGWVNAVGTIGGKSAGVAMTAPTLDSEEDCSWYIFARVDLPFWYINPAIVQPGPIRLKQGESFTHDYDLIVHDGSWSPESK